MSTSLRYTTFGPGELEARLRELAPDVTPYVPENIGSAPNSVRIKAHTFCVTFPDGCEGTCRYERLAPRWHRFRYQYADRTELPWQGFGQSLANDLVAIEAKGKEMAAGCYWEAIARERKDYFQRASPPSDGSRKKNPALYRMKATTAKLQAGKYALCQRTGETYMTVGPLRDTLEAANADWKARGETRCVVACCSRLDRCWLLPRFNSLYAEFDPRPDSTMLRPGIEDMNEADNGETGEEVGL